MKIYIFSEVSYDDNKHINQYFFDYLNNHGFECYFVERVTMNIPKLGYIKRIKNKIKNLFKKEKCNRDNIPKKNIITTFIFPPLPMFKMINKLILRYRKLILNNEDVLVTFVPHKHIIDISGENSKIVYYCVHDTAQQNYPNKIHILSYERNILAKKSLVFCDNSDVINKLGLTSINYIGSTSNYNMGYNAYLMPPPVPDDFFVVRSNNANKKPYDFVYYGSFHKDIDNDIIISISKKHSILIISNNCPNILHGCENITVKPSIYSMNKLANEISSAKNILLPYKNSQFMETITPAKILQVKALSMPVLCTNHYLSKKYNISSDIGDMYIPIQVGPEFSVENICSFIKEKIDTWL